MMTMAAAKTTNTGKKTRTDREDGDDEDADNCDDTEDDKEDEKEEEEEEDFGCYYASGVRCAAAPAAESVAQNGRQKKVSTNASHNDS